MSSSNDGHIKCICCSGRALQSRSYQYWYQVLGNIWLATLYHIFLVELWNKGTYVVCIPHTACPTPATTREWNTNDIQSEIWDRIGLLAVGRMYYCGMNLKNTTTVEFLGYCSSIMVLHNHEIHLPLWY